MYGDPGGAFGWGAPDCSQPGGAHREHPHSGNWLEAGCAVPGAPGHSPYPAQHCTGFPPAGPRSAGGCRCHAGYNPAEHYRSKAVPIYQTAVFELGDYDRGLRLFEYAEEGHSYVRFSNPTNTVLEKRISALEGGAAAVSFASGMAAISSTLLNLAKAGDEIISVNTLYGGSTTLLAKLFPDYGITPRFAADENDIDAYRRLINDHTRAIYIECLGNPGINILDIEAIAALAHARI